MMPSCRSAKMMNVAYRLKTRVVLRDRGQQRSPDQAYTSFSHQLPFKIRPGSTPNQATLDAIQRARRIAESADDGSGNKQVGASTDAFQLRASLNDPVARVPSSSAMEALVRLDRISHVQQQPSSSKSVSKITGKLIQVKRVISACPWKNNMAFYNSLLNIQCIFLNYTGM